MIHPSRVQQLNERPIRSRGRYVLYWMQASQRTRLNHALEYCIEQANALKLPPLVCFGLTDDYPEANERHYAFLLQGLEDVAGNLKRRGIGFVINMGAPARVGLHFSRQAALVVCDRGYQRLQKRWRDEMADEAGCRVVQLESDIVVPVEVTSDKAEWAARTIRPRIHRHLPDYLKLLRPLRVQHRSIDLADGGPAPVTLQELRIDRNIPAVSRFRGGEKEAARMLGEFVQKKLPAYAELRNEPSAAATSFMSPYLHFGHISPIEIALAAGASETYIEELIIRRELAINFVHYTPNYDSYESIPDWARRSLARHALDPRPYVYTCAQLERAQTHDRWWNAAQTEMTATGFMHNYMRMYWGKKILEWSKTPEEAYATTLHLNNKFFLDGRDALSYANVGWIFGLHDRPWTERPVFGQIRYMNDAGLERKFDMEKYEAWVNQLGG